MIMAKMLGLDEFVVKLFDVEGLKFGDFVMRTGEHTPIYIDMRVIWSYPDLVVIFLVSFIIAQCFDHILVSSCLLFKLI